MVGLAVGCAASQPPGDPLLTRGGGTEMGEAPAQDGVSSVAAAAVADALVVEVRDVAVVGGRQVRFRGRVTNRYAHTVDGVVYRVRLLSTDGQRALRSEYEEIDTQIGAGESDAFEIELQTMYVATVPRFSIEAIPVRLGDHAFAPPSDWR